MLSKRQQLAKALVFATTVAGILVGNLWVGFWLGGYIQELGYTSYGKVLGVVVGLATAIFSIYKTLRLNFLVSKKNPEDKKR